MMRIVHLTTVHQRDDIRIFRKQCVSLASAGHDVTLVVADGKGDAAVEGISVRDIGRPSNRLQRAGKSFAARALIRQLRPDFVHFHDPELMPLGIALRFMGYRVIYDVHEDVPATIKTKRWLPLGTRHIFAFGADLAERLSGRLLHRIVAATPYIASKFPPDRTSLVQNFPLKDELVAPEGNPAADGIPTFVFVGGITRERGYAEMIEATERLNASGTACRLCLVGKIMPGSSISQPADTPHIAFTGHQPRKEVADILSSAHAGLVLFHPTENHINAQPNKMFEYMSAGLAVIASDFPLWRGIVEGNECGLCVDPLDSSAIAGAMRWIVENPDEAKAMGQRGRKAVMEFYNWDRELTSLSNIYVCACSEREAKGRSTG